MTIIFFDLETSDKEPCAQILNYSFIRTDNSFQFQDELSGNIALSDLQIPSPEALLTNRIKILDHQSNNFPTEPQALRSIVDFIGNSILVSKDQVFLSGYNSTRFDLPFLRTSLIRNGLNPYFSGKIKYCDILHLVRKAYLCKQNFPEVSSKEDPGKVSLRLELVTKALGLLKGAQSHDSREDVLLTIKLCQKLKEDFDLHPATYNAYEPGPGETLFFCATPNYDKTNSSERAIEKAIGLLNESYRAALWLDFEKYKAGEGRAAISWYNKNGGILIKGKKTEFSLEHNELLKRAKAEFSGLSPDNFFPKSSCDIEQDIYRLDMQKISSLTQVIWENERSLMDSIKDKDLQDLLSRYFLAYGLSPARRGAKWQEKFNQYAKYRYGGGNFQLPKSVLDAPSQDSSRIIYHSSLLEVENSILILQKEKKEPEDREILRQLQEYIENSSIKAALEGAAKST